MAKSYQTTEGTVFIPGAYPQYKVINQNSAIAGNGVLIVIGEADGGPHWSEETSLKDNAFGPDQEAEFKSKYVSGNLVDAFRGAVAASNDPEITASFSRFIAIKTNSPSQASGLLPAVGGGNYATLLDKNYGKSGNLINRTITVSQAEVLPSTGSFVLAPPHVSTDVAFRVNGGAAVSATLTAAQLPSAMVSAINALAGVAATGGASRSVITSVAGNLTLVVDSGNQVHFNITTSWANNPSVGDILYVPTGSPFGVNNEGTYIVTAVSSTRIDAYKVLDAAGTGAQNTAPTNQGPVAVAATSDLQAFSPVVITLEASAVSPGLGKSLEVANSGSASFGNNAYVFNSAASPVAAAATWVSTSSVPYAISGTEQKVNVNISRQSDNVSEDLVIGGTVVMTLGYKGTSGSCVISSGVMTITVVGGAGTSPAALTLSNFATVADLCTYLSSLTGFTAAPATASVGQKSPSVLDEGTYTIGSTQGAAVARIKNDGYEFNETVDASVLCTVEPIAPATKLIGLPDVAALAFLSGGAKGSSTAAAVAAAIDAANNLRGNFVIPLFSQDASLDIAAGKTESSSTYTIAAVNAALRSHVLTQSTMKRRRARQGFASIRSTFAAAKNAAANLAQPLMACAFEDCKDLDSSGNIVQFQPWMTAVKAAAMQAGGFYKPITNKQVNASGFVQAAGDFDDQNESQVEDALKAGLLIAKTSEDGGFVWVSDQTTYSKDNNPVYNSIQSMYAVSLVSLTAAQRMEKAFVGQSVADVSSALARTTFESILDDLRGLKLLTGDSDAPRGYKDVTVKRSGNALPCTALVKVSTGIDFIPISFLVTTVSD